MPRKKRKNKVPRSGRLRKAFCERDVVVGDLAIDDFSDTKNAKEALKRVARGFAINSAALVSDQGKENTVPWFERIDFDSEGEDEQERAIEGKIKAASKGLKKNSKKKVVPSVESTECGVTYPLDVWCLLARYIRPEHIQSFALICKGARDAINMRTFWLRLYKRHISQPRKLPERLQPDRIECRPGLRARIVRALFHGYEPLRTQWTSNFGFTVPSVLESQMCISMWYKQGICKKQTKKVWVFYFKFSQKSDYAKRAPSYFSPKWLEQVDDLSYNPEERKTVLQVNCVNFLPVAPVQGHVLTKALVGVSRDMKHNSVKLTFHTPRFDGRYRKEEGKSVVLDPAYDVKVINWWRPGYPRQEYEL